MVLKEEGTENIETLSSSKNEEEVVNYEEEIEPYTGELLIVQRLLQSLPVKLE